MTINSKGFPHDEEVNKLAVVVGTNEVSSSDFVNLISAENDAVDMASTLQQPACDFKSPTLLLGTNAASENVRRAVIKLAKQKTEQDFLLFYFSGLAMWVEMSTGYQDVYLGTHDFSPEDVREEPTSHLSLSWLRDKLYEQTGAGRVLIILDCAYAGGILQADAGRLVLEEFNSSKIQRTTGSTRAILAATGMYGLAMEKNGHGVLTGMLLSVLRGEVTEALDANGRVDILSLYTYLSSKIPEAFPQQIPVLAGEFGRDLILADYSHALTYHTRNLRESVQVQTNSTVPTSPASPLQQTHNNEISAMGSIDVTSQQATERPQTQETVVNLPDLKEAQALPQRTKRTPAQPEPIEVDVTIGALADIPSNKDLLKFSDYAQAIVDLIKSDKTEKPLTIMIDATWGMGKTTLMKLVQKELEKKQMGKSFPTVWFNAWKYDQEESLWAALVLTILRQVKEQFNMQQKIKFWWRLSRDRLDQSVLLQSIFKSLLYIFGLILILGILIVVVWLSSGNTLQETIIIMILRFKLYIILFGGGFLTVLFTFGKDIYNRIIKPLRPNITKYLRGPNYEERIGFLAQFEEDFSFVVKAITDGGKWPLVIFIDDLDRCVPAKCVEIIEAVNILLDTKYCVFLIGMDAQTVAGSIEAKYKDLHGYLSSLDNPGDLTLGERFLEKIVQINFRIPKADSKLLESFINTNLNVLEQNSDTVSKVKRSEKKELTKSGAVELIQAEMRAGKNMEDAAQAVKNDTHTIPDNKLEEAKKEIKSSTFNSEPVQLAIHSIARYLDANPRKIKRFINVFMLQTLIASRRGLLKTGAIQLDLLAQWLIVSVQWPDIVEAIMENPNFLSDLKDAYGAKEQLRQLRRDSNGREEEEVLERGYQARIDYYIANPYIKRLINATDLMVLLNNMTNTQLLNYLYFTRTTL